MKIAVMTDMEGVSGVLDFDNWCDPKGAYYLDGKRLLTEEVNAAVRGFIDGGIDDITIIDGHGHGGINFELLDERVKYSRGWDPLYAFGLDDTFDGLAFVGQHAKACTPGSHLSHTGWFDTIDLKINGISLGEYGYLSAIAAKFSVKPFFVAGEEKIEEEAKAITPWVHTVSGKKGVALTSGEDLDFNAYSKHFLGAVHIHPVKVREKIYLKAKEATMDFIKNPDRFKTLDINPPYTIESLLRREESKPERYKKTENINDILEAFIKHYTS